MAWWSRLTDGNGWLYWTVGGKATRDAWRGHPTPDAVREVESLKSDLDDLTRLLLDLMDKPASPAGDEPGGVTSDRRVKKDDFSDAQVALRAVLARRNVKPDSISSEALAGLLTDLSRIVRRSHELRAEETSPAGPEQLTFFESEMIQHAELEIDKLCQRWQERKNALEARLSRIQHRLEHLLIEFKTRNARHEKKLLREVHRLIPLPVYALLLLAIGITEYPLNAAAFEVLNATPLQGFGIEVRVGQIIAAVPSIGVPFLAHVLGMTFRQSVFDASKRTTMWTEMLVGTTAALAVMACLVAVGFLRAEFQKDEETADRTAITGAPPPASSADINWPDAVALLAINGVGFVVGFAASYFAHDPDRELEQICKHQKRCWKQIEKKLDEWGRIASDYDEERGTAITRILWFRHEAIAKLDEYRHYNWRTHSPHQRPPSFQRLAGERLFRPRHFGGEIDPPPVSHDLLLDRVRSVDVPVEGRA